MHRPVHASGPAASPRFAGGLNPNLVFAGAPKCGALQRRLAAYPDVFGSFEKETCFLPDLGTHIRRLASVPEKGSRRFSNEFGLDLSSWA